MQLELAHTHEPASSFQMQKVLSCEHEAMTFTPTPALGAHATSRTQSLCAENAVKDSVGLNNVEHTSDCNRRQRGRQCVPHKHVSVAATGSKPHFARLVRHQRGQDSNDTPTHTLRTAGAQLTEVQPEGWASNCDATAHCPAKHKIGTDTISRQTTHQLSAVGW